MGLTPSQQSMVNIGASVGAGCHPCLRHHMEAGKNAGLSRAELQNVLNVAETTKRASVESLARLGCQLLEEREVPASPCCIHLGLDSELVAIGVAIGANDVSQFRRHVAAARQAGLTEADADTCVQLAQVVQRRAAEFTASAIQPSIVPAKTAPSPECGPACGCTAPQPLTQVTSGGQT